MANEGIGRATLLDRSRRREPTAARALHKQADGIVREHRWQRRAKEDLFQHRHEWTGSRSGSHRSKTFSGMSGQSSNPSPWCFAVRRLARHKGPFGLALFWSVIFIVVPMQVPLITGALSDSLKGKHVRLYGLELDPAKRQRSVKIAALALMGVALTRGVSAYLRQLSLNKLSRRFVCETRHDLIERLTTMSLERHFQFGAGELLHRVIVDTATLRRFTNQVVIRSATNVLRVLCPMLVLFVRQPLLAAAACSVIPVQWVLTLYLQKQVHQARTQARRTRSSFTTVLKEQRNSSSGSNWSKPIALP